jgi:hypothetical protein
MSTGVVPKSVSRTSSLPSSVAMPSTANGQRSRSASARNCASRAGAIAST